MKNSLITALAFGALACPAAWGSSIQINFKNAAQLGEGRPASASCAQGTACAGGEMLAVDVLDAATVADAEAGMLSEDTTADAVDSIDAADSADIATPDAADPDSGSETPTPAETPSEAVTPILQTGDFDRRRETTLKSSPAASLVISTTTGDQPFE